MAFADWVTRGGDLLEVVGVAAIVVGAVVATAAMFRRGAGADRYRTYRQALGRAILLGLEFLVAADIVRTVSRVPTLQQVSVLGLIVLIRTFLSFTLEVELEGRWPWQRRGRRLRVPPRPPERPDAVAARPH